MRQSCHIEVECANCAAKMERAVARLEGVEEVSINYLLQKLVIEYSTGADPAAVLAEVRRVCRGIEPDCEIS